LAAGQDTQNSWPAGITGFGLGVTDQPRAETPTGTDALAGTPAAPAATAATKTTDTFAAQNFMITPMLQSQFAGPRSQGMPSRSLARPARAATCSRSAPVTPGQ